MITLEFEATEDVNSLAVLQNGHQIGRVESMTNRQLTKQIAELNRAAVDMHLNRNMNCRGLDETDTHNGKQAL